MAEDPYRTNALTDEFASGPEIRSIELCARALDPLDDGIRLRVMAYLCKLYNIEPAELDG